MSGFIQDAIAEELPFLRAEATARMGAENGSSTGTFRRRTPGTTQDESTGLKAPTWTDTHVDLIARFSHRAAATSSRSTSQVGGTDQAATLVLSVPFATENVLDGDLFDVTAGQRAGKVFKVIESTTSDQTTALRLPVVEVPRPKEW